MKKYKILEGIRRAGVVAVLRGDSPEEAVRFAEKAVEGGIRAIEITMTVPYALEAVTALTKKYHGPGAPVEGVLIGAGTVLDSETARSVIMAGAEFVVSPSLNRDVITLCNRYGVPVMPGCMTIREMTEALELGVDVVKLFPGNLYSPSAISTIRGPLPQINIMPTGGVNVGNLKDWIKAGAFAVGIGSDLTREAKKTGNDDLVAERARSYMQAFREATGQANPN